MSTAVKPPTPAEVEALALEYHELDEKMLEPQEKVR